MADASATPDAPIVARLVAHPERYTFFQAARILSALAEARPDLGGVDGGPGARMRFRSTAALSFPSGDLSGLEVRGRTNAEGDLYDFEVNFLGVYGPSSPLPLYFTELAMADDEEGAIVRDFLDIFNHRLLSLLWEAWRRNQLVAEADAELFDRIARRLLSLFSVDREDPPFGAGDLYWAGLLRATGALTLSTRPPGLAEDALSSVFGGAPFRIEEFVRREVEIPSDQRAKLGVQGATLGADIHLGDRAPDVGGKARIVVGPLTRAEYEAFLPDRAAYARLREAAAFILKRPIEFEVALDLSPGEAAATRLGDAATARAGWTTWLGAPPDDAHRLRLGRPARSDRAAGMS